MSAAVFAFGATMIDNFFAYAAQITVTPMSHHKKAQGGQIVGLLTLITVSLLFGSLVSHVSHRWLAVLALLPLTLAWRAWVQRNQELGPQEDRNFAATYFVTLALGGDNVAVWLPLLALATWPHRFITVAIFILLDLFYLWLATSVARHPLVVTKGQALAPRVLPVLYFFLTLLIVVESRIL